MKDRTAFAAVLTALVAIPVAAASGWLAHTQPAAPVVTVTVKQALRSNLALVDGSADVSWYWVSGPGGKTEVQDAQMMLAAKTKTDWAAVEAFGLRRTGSRFVKATCSTWNEKGAAGNPFANGSAEAVQHCSLVTVPRSAVVKHYRTVDKRQRPRLTS